MVREIHFPGDPGDVPHKQPRMLRPDGTPNFQFPEAADSSVRIDLAIGNSVIPLDLRRNSTLSDETAARLLSLGTDGMVAIEPNLKPFSRKAQTEEYQMAAAHPEEQAPYQALGFVLSQEGFARFDEPFDSLNDPKTRKAFRQIADNIASDFPPVYHPADTARRALSVPREYADGQQREWDKDEVLSHLSIAFAERGLIFPDIGEHATRHNPRWYWPAVAARMVAVAEKLSHPDLPLERRPAMVARIQRDMQFLEDFAEVTAQQKADLHTKLALVSKNGLA